jgi:hypothetical protein
MQVPPIVVPPGLGFELRTEVNVAVLERPR